MLEGLTPPEKIIPCAIRTMLEMLSEEDRAILSRALADKDAWPSRALSRALTERGIPVSDKPIGKHRSGKCSCE